jgi:hypothetical protein
LIVGSTGVSGVDGAPVCCGTVAGGATVVVVVAPVALVVVVVVCDAPPVDAVDVETELAPVEVSVELAEILVVPVVVLVLTDTFTRGAVTLFPVPGELAFAPPVAPALDPLFTAEVIDAAVDCAAPVFPALPVTTREVVVAVLATVVTADITPALLAAVVPAWANCSGVALGFLAFSAVTASFTFV